MYEKFALVMRYAFMLFAVGFVARAWIMTVRDNRRASLIRAWLPETGTVGEWLVLEGQKKGEKLPMLREGVIGSSRASDVRLKGRDINGEHAYFEVAGDEVAVTPLKGAPILATQSVGGEFYPDENGRIIMHDGDAIVIGDARLLLTLFRSEASVYHVAEAPAEPPAEKKPPKKSRKKPAETPAENAVEPDFFEPAPDEPDFFEPAPLKKKTARARASSPAAPANKNNASRKKTKNSGLELPWEEEKDPTPNRSKKR